MARSLCQHLSHAHAHAAEPNSRELIAVWNCVLASSSSVSTPPRLNLYCSNHWAHLLELVSDLFFGSHSVRG